MNRITLRSDTVTGFTLLEILVSLAIFSVISASIFYQIQSSNQVIMRVRQKYYASWIASNVMQKYFIERVYPDTGEEDIDYEMGGVTWRVQVEIDETDLEDVRKIEISVYEDSESQESTITLSQLIGKQ